MKHLKKLTIVMVFVMLLSVVFTMNVFAEGHDQTTESAIEYKVSGSIKDNPETDVDENAVLKELIVIYGKHPATSFSFSETANCKNKLDVTINGQIVSVWTSEILVPNGSKLIIGKDGNFYYYYDKETGIYNNECTFEYKGETITGYFAQKVDPAILEEKSTTDDSALKEEAEIKSLQDVIDCLIELESDITILMVGLIVVSVFSCVAICFCIITRYKYLTLRDEVQALSEKKNKKSENESNHVHSKKKKHK